MIRSGTFPLENWPWIIWLCGFCVCVGDNRYYKKLKSEVIKKHSQFLFLAKEQEQGCGCGGLPDGSIPKMTLPQQ